MINIFETKPGDMIKFHGNGGYPAERKAAHKLFTVGEKYTVRKIDIGNFTSFVHLEGIQGSFNTVMFSNINND